MEMYLKNRFSGIPSTKYPGSVLEISYFELFKYTGSGAVLGIAPFARRKDPVLRQRLVFLLKTISNYSIIYLMEYHYARAFDNRGVEYSKKAFKLRTMVERDSVLLTNNRK